MKDRPTASNFRELREAIVGQSAYRPNRVGAYLRSTAVRLLDDQFESSSPIPYLAPEALSSIQSSEVVLPPRKWLEDGNQSLDGLVFLVGLARAMSAKHFFEIGTYNGITSWCIARNVPGIIVDTLDLEPTIDPIFELETSDHNHRRELDHRSYPLPPGAGTVLQHWGDSAKFDFSPWNSRCDIVYVDGAHSAPYVRSDTENALRMVGDYGVIVWDDYWRQIDGVRKILDEFSSGPLKGQIWRVPGTRLVVRIDAGTQGRLLERSGEA